MKTSLSINNAQSSSRLLFRRRDALTVLTSGGHKHFNAK
jgi:hypothetical protein